MMAVLEQAVPEGVLSLKYAVLRKEALSRQVGPGLCAWVVPHLGPHRQRGHQSYPLRGLLAPSFFITPLPNMELRQLHETLLGSNSEGAWLAHRVNVGFGTDGQILATLTSKTITEAAQWRPLEAGPSDLPSSFGEGLEGVHSCWDAGLEFVLHHLWGHPLQPAHVPCGNPCFLTSS